MRKIFMMVADMDTLLGTSLSKERSVTLLLLDASLIAVLIGLQLQVALVGIDHPLLCGPAGSLLGGRDLPVRVGVVHFDRLLLFGVFNLLFGCRLRWKRFPQAGTNPADVG
jgi:hypothetical protein